MRRGDSLGKLAHDYGTSVAAIQAANKLGGRKLVRPGTYLLIPVLAAETPGPRAKKFIAAAATSPSASTGPRRLTYVVRRGDTLASIGRRHNVSVRQIMRWNRKRSQRIVIGERLRIYVASAD